jgi:hypothetical protein
MKIKGAKTIVAILAFIFFATAYGAIIDPEAKGPEREFLNSLAHRFDVRGIDTVFGVASALPVGQRARVGSLHGYAPIKQGWGSFAAGGWMHAFHEGIAGVIVGFLPPNLEKKDIACSAGPEIDPEGCAFVREWLKSDPDKRVFIAFSKDDLDEAEKVASALRDEGYVAFVFLRDKSEKPWAAPALVGELFEQARHKLVIDTANTRSSAGVRFESMCCEWHLMPPYPKTPLSQMLAGK